jgi:AI-2 transport protein TqsA
MTTNQSPPAPVGLPRGLLILGGLASATIAIAGLKASAGILGPTLLALVLVITMYPVRRRLDALGLPGWLSGLATILSVYLVLVLMILALMLSVGRLAALLPAYTSRINSVAGDLGDWLEQMGVGSAQVQTVIDSVDIGQLLTVATSILSGSLGVLSNLLLIATLVLFLAFDARPFSRHLLAARNERPAVVDALLLFARGTRTYFAVSAGFGLIVAVIDGVALALMGIPGALAWGVLAFVTNFIPNIGFVIGVVPPAIIGLLEGGVGTMIAVIVLYSAINVVVQTIIQPKFVGDAIGLTATLTFVSLLVWAWILGPLGAILAIPLTLLTKALLVDVDPGAAWLIPLLSSKDPPFADEPTGQHAPGGSA